jgi:dipeptidyl-peptidase-4
MKKMKRFFVLIFLLIAANVFAQTKILTLEDAYGSKALYPKTMKQLQWIVNTNTFSYVEYNKLIKGNVENEKRDTLIKLLELSDAVKKLGDNDIVEFPEINWKSENSFYFKENNKIYLYDLAAKKVQVIAKLNEKSENTDISGKTLYAAYTVKNNLFVSAKGKEYAVTADSNINIVNGKSVHRDEFGITKGTFWSPNGNYLAFYRMDQTMVTDYPIVHIDGVSNRIAEAEMIKYPMAGMTSHHVTVGIFNPLTQKKIFLKTGEPAEQYLTNITWSPDEKYIFIQVLNRGQNHMKLNQYDATTGDFVKTLFEEVNEKYVEPLNPLYFLSTKPDEFIYQCQRDGYNHLYLYDINGKLLKQITKGKWVVTEFLGTDAKDTKAFYISTAVNPLERHIYSVDLKNNKTVKISSNDGVHSAKISNDGKFVLDNYSSTTMASEYNLETSDGKILQTLLKNVNTTKIIKCRKCPYLLLKRKTVQIFIAV